MADYDLRTGPQIAQERLTALESRVTTLETTRQRPAFVAGIATAAAVLLALVVLVSCTSLPSTPAPTPSVYADVAPAPVPQEFNCSITGDNAAFTMACAEATATPTATPEIAFWYLWCAEGETCAPFRVYWDPQQRFLRCAIDTGQNGMKVTVKAMMAPDREIMAPLAWVVTGQALANGEACEGWIEQRRLSAAW